ncbi:fumarylacetoacetate hydrolase family protein [Sagittula salina]|uniref:Fumarylacetoacetate hydrolase family protein n=1 Tax=Sagittula salina TaxID=2820268 RepID=A0A940MGT7_9RHOB|nr:fumarylacetoacetate hydrolase family protein [Sagittula salina]MBP0481256.1 fumarylacetoacetate hydrolase family protein [Sagittula salina]
MVKFVSFTREGAAGYGLWQEDGILDMTGFDNHAGLREVIAAGALKALAQAAVGRTAYLPHDAVTLEIPVRDPEKILCVGVNYPDRNAEYRDGQAAERPSLFVRFARSFVGHGSPLVRPPESGKLDYEGEIAIVIGRGGRRIAPEDAYDHIVGLTLCNEGTIRDWVRHAKFNVTQGKNWDASGAMGPWMVPFTHPSQLDDVGLECRVNGEVRQKDRTGRMLYNFRYIVNYVSTFTTLVPGDVIVCGTPTGAGARFDPPVWLKPGDVVEVEAEGIGILRNGVVDE